MYQYDKFNTCKWNTYISRKFWNFYAKKVVFTPKICIFLNFDNIYGQQYEKCKERYIHTKFHTSMLNNYFFKKLFLWNFKKRWFCPKKSNFSNCSRVTLSHPLGYCFVHSRVRLSKEKKTLSDNFGLGGLYQLTANKVFVNSVLFIYLTSNLFSNKTTYCSDCVSMATKHSQCSQ